MSGNISQYRSWDRADRGMILVMVLILLGLIVALVIQAQVAARMSLMAEERKSQQVQLRAAATEAAWSALVVLAGDTDLRVDHTNEPWAASLDQVLPNGIETSVQMIDENCFFDVNNISARLSEKMPRAPLEIVRDLLALSRQPDPAMQAQVLKDWIDPDHEGLREAAYYQGLNGAQSAMNPPVTVADTLMESPQELADVLALAGSGGEVPPGLTVLPDRGARIMPINVNTASRDVMLAVVGPQEARLADALCSLRNAGPLTSLAPLNRLMKAGQENPWGHYFDVKSSFFSILARATRGECSEAIYALVHRDPLGNIDILRWVCR